jgi:GrpB-like predicted nucleotidyltransferase (UPF0157 family)
MIELIDYNPLWREQFALLKQQIWPVVSAYADRIEHVGSTAVEGLCAKPVIDLDVVIKSRSNLQNIIQGLATIGYSHKGDLGISGREAFIPDSPDFKHHLYVCLEDCLAFRNHILLRDHLRNTPEDRFKYSELKKGLAKKYGDDIDSYIKGKTEFIISILEIYDVDKNELSSIKRANQKP